jgi:hypothetical protein
MIVPPSLHLMEKSLPLPGLSKAGRSNGPGCSAASAWKKTAVF